MIEKKCPQFAMGPVQRDHAMFLMSMTDLLHNIGIGLACLPRPGDDYREKHHCTLTGFGHLGYEKKRKELFSELAREEGKEEDKEDDKDKDKDKDKEELIPINADKMQQVSGTVWNQSKLKKIWNPLHGVIKLVRDNMIGKFVGQRQHDW